MFVLRSNTISKEFEKLNYLYQNIDFYNKHGYNLNLPSGTKFNELMKSKKYYEAYKVFKQMYKKIDMSKIKIIDKLDKRWKSVYKKLKILNDNWNFKLSDKYTIILTRYTPGGEYRIDTNTIYVGVHDDDTLMTFGDDPVNNIIHEIVHIGIEKNIIQHFKIQHADKECIVDTICSIYLKLPKYNVQTNFTNKKIVKLLNVDGILNLPDNLN